MTNSAPISDAATSDLSITILVDNKGPQDLAVEHGLSLWIEVDGVHILFDTGQGQALAPNARALGIDLGTTDALVLSHGHYDHTGAIPYLLTQAPDALVYFHPGALQPHYAVRDGAARAICMPRESHQALGALPVSRVHHVTEPFMLTAHVGLSGPVPRETEYEDVGGPFYLDAAGTRPDLMEDDLSLWIVTERGLVVCLGCAHAGVINILLHVLRVSGATRLRAVVGGFHLVNADADRLNRTAAALKSLAPDTVVPCHCTGDHAVALLGRTLKSSPHPGATGDTYRFRAGTRPRGQ